MFELWTQNVTDWVNYTMIILSYFSNVYLLWPIGIKCFEIVNDGGSSNAQVTRVCETLIGL